MDEGVGLVLAELLSHALAKAVIENLAPRPTLHLARRDADLAPAQDEHGLPLPMIPGNAATPTTLCAIEVRAGFGWGCGQKRPLQPAPAPTTIAHAGLLRCPALIDPCYPPACCLSLPACLRNWHLSVLPASQTCISLCWLHVKHAYVCAAGM